MTSTATPDRTFTTKGLATRRRIVEAASRLILEHGMEAATLGAIQDEAHVSASQLYHYFTDKGSLLLAVIDHQSEQVLGPHRAALSRLDSFEALEGWRDMVIDMIEAQNCVGGCPLGSLAGSLAESDPVARSALEQSFAEWERLLRDGLAAMQRRGELRGDVDVDDLAVSVLAGLQGGLLLSQTRRDSRSVRIALDASIAYLRTLRTA